MNPNTVAQNRTARLAREASTPVYTTETPVREHLYVAEVEADIGGRFWSQPMTEADLNVWVDEKLALDYDLSDWDHASKCWCSHGNPHPAGWKE